MRLFLGVFPDPNLREYFRHLRQLLYKYKRNFKFVEIDQIHLTIKFLGNQVNEETYKEYSDLLKQKLQVVKPFEFNIMKPRFGFVSQRMATVLFSQIAKSNDLDFLSNVANEISKRFHYLCLSVKKDRKDLTHHITLARLKSHFSKAFKKEIDEKLSLIKPPEALCRIDSLYFIESHLKKTGPVYKVIERINL